ncbi:regulatory protein ToxS [Vibrio cortegadensis]|uniref:regulatory protein ToxS n=1 Tax=Vibrio cortegadensis TaxID=1328770 RepID=UPI0021C2FB96|nr:regulatory protein ToxS [Vibrio cortegadensis]MDN3698774.1 regulatory protein ToxS [Vibrio cortegadensis]
MKLKLAYLALALSSVLSAWMYWGSDIKVEQVLTSKEWQSRMVSLITNNDKESAIGPLSKVEVTSNVKYLPNGSYIRVSRMELFGNEKESQNTINISETGEWDISDNYLLISPTEFKDVSSAQSKEFTPEQLTLITQVFKLDSQQSRRIDIVNQKTLLLTSLNHGSTVLFTN